MNIYYLQNRFIDVCVYMQNNKMVTFHILLESLE